MESDSDEDTEKQLEDLEQLTAVLEADGEASSVTFSGSRSRCSASRSGTSAKGSCSNIEEYSRIETALALNRLTDLKLQRLENVLGDRLRQCRQRIADLQSWEAVSQKRMEKFRYFNCGKPYFRDADNFPAPDNSDTLLMAKSDMYDFSSVVSVPGWTVKDKSEFISSMLKMSREYRVKEINSKMAEIRRDKSLTSANKEKELDEWKKKLSTINKKPLKDVALPIDQEYDWDTIANKLNRRHSPTEYRALWRLFLHPSINKESWSKTEHTLLQQLAHGNLQDWDKIAEDLNTNRTGYQCFVYFRTNMSNTFTGTKWTKEEEEYLKRLIEYYREDNYIPWGRVAASMENRTKIQVYNKYLRLQEHRKGRFLPEEDAVILNCVAHFGHDFRKIQNFLPGRSHLQLRTRYDILSKKSLSSVWTVSEDRKLIQLMANQDSTTNYSSICKYFPGKDRTSIRARHLTLLKWLKRNPNVDISRAPRRGARRLCHGQAMTNINKAVEKLKNRMQTEIESKRPKRVTKDSSEADIEEAIVALLVTEKIKEEESKESLAQNQLLTIDDETTISADKLNITNLRKILMFLKSKLNKHQFNISSYSDLYPDLADADKEVSLVKLKSYSRKEVVNTIKLAEPPNIWGEQTLGAIEYVMPPNFATITGCRTLITHITSRSLPKVDVNILKARNPIFREQLYILMERFNILFLWPLLLSNEGPAGYQDFSVKPFLFPNINPLRLVKDKKTKKKGKFIR